MFRVRDLVNTTTTMVALTSPASSEWPKATAGGRHSAIHSSMGEYRLARPLLQQALVVVVLFTKSLTRNIWPTG